MSLFPELEQKSSSSLFPELESKDSFLTSPAAQKMGEAITQGPSQMMATIPDIASYAAGKGSDIAQQQMQQAGVNPTVSGIASGVMKYSPDIAMTAATPLKAPTEVINAAIQPMSRALGIKSVMRGTDFARGKVAQAAKIALQEGIMPALGNPETAFQNATNLKNVAGEGLGQMREVPTKIDTIFNGLDILRQKVTQGSQTGFEEVHGLIDNAQNKLLGLLERGKELTLNDIEETKKAIADSVNYFKDTPGAQGLNKKIVGTIENEVENLLGEAGADKSKYKDLKTKFGAAKTMLMGLNKEIAMQQGNNAQGLTSIAMGAAELASGSPLRAAGTMGMAELAKRRGWAITANLINAVGNNPGGVGYATSLGLNKFNNQNQ